MIKNILPQSISVERSDQWLLEQSSGGYYYKNKFNTYTFILLHIRSTSEAITCTKNFLWFHKI